MAALIHKPAIVQRLKKIARKRQHARQHVGAAPGTIFETPDASESDIRAQVCGTASVEPVAVSELGQIKQLQQQQATGSTLWIDIQGLADIQLIVAIGQHFNLHPMVIEDVINVGQRPKADIHDDDYVVVLMREPCGGPPFDSEQLAIVFGPGFVLTFQERHGDIFDPVRKRILEGSRRLRESGAAYLGYTLIDAVIDRYFPILEGYGDLTEAMEQRAIEDPTPDMINEIHLLKRELLEMRRALWSQREAINVLLRDDTALIPDALKIYLRDCADHSFQLLDLVESYREVAQGLVDLHLSSVSNRMNEIMKVLTVLATIFIPMTFIAGLYGMNFDASSPWNMPELKWRFGYLYCLGLMALSTIAMLIYFRRKGLIGK